MRCLVRQSVLVLSGLVTISMLFQLKYVGVVDFHIFQSQNLTWTRQAALDKLKPCVFNLTKHNKSVSPEKRKLLISQDPTFLHHVQPGGVYKSRDCKATGNVAIIVPYRDREEQLPIFLKHMHHFLQTQKIGYTIFIIEMTKGVPFNRGILMNIGFHVATRLRNFTCFVFHDVDLLPVHEGNVYDCPERVRLLASANSKYNYRLLYPSYFGGVVSFSESQYRQINGFSNLYFGWGQEDDDLFQRVVTEGFYCSYHSANRVKSERFPVLRINSTLGRYEAMNHSEPGFDHKPQVQRNELLKNCSVRKMSEGLNSVLFREVSFEYRRLYTWTLVEINKTDLHHRFKLCRKKGWPCDFKHITEHEIKAEENLRKT